MINSLVTIIIPIENCVFELKTTIENLITQTKIKGTSILVLDNKSDDGGASYAYQASSDYSKIVRISVIDASKEDYEINKDELNKYVLWIKPGITFKSKDSIINIINTVMEEKNILILSSGKLNFFNSYYLKKGKTQINCLLCEKKDLGLVDYKKEGDNIFFPFNQKIRSKKYKIIKDILSDR